NLAPDKQPTAKDKKAALDWLARDLDDALIKFIRNAKPSDALRGCFYEFTYQPVLKELLKAIDRGVDLQLIVDDKPNTDSFPRTENRRAIKVAGLPKTAMIYRRAWKSVIAHNKFLVRLVGQQRKPTEVWTGSTNLTDGGIHGQANVGHWVRAPAVAQSYLD